MNSTNLFIKYEFSTLEINQLFMRSEEFITFYQHFNIFLIKNSKTNDSKSTFLLSFYCHCTIIHTTIFNIDGVKQITIFIVYDTSVTPVLLVQEV